MWIFSLIISNYEPMIQKNVLLQLQHPKKLEQILMMQFIFHVQEVFFCSKLK